MKHLEEFTWKVAKANAGVAVIYKRGNEGMDITVVPCGGGNDALSFKGQPLQNPSKTFTAGVADLRNFYPPKKDDVIQFRETGKTYTVSKEATGAVYSEAGAYGIMIQIHTVEVR